MMVSHDSKKTCEDLHTAISDMKCQPMEDGEFTVLSPKGNQKHKKP